ncbi:MAG TPA: hypothetical protein VGZ47_05160, partial [Gemmataceae bacterium]|nr:hypothetical protein [Gemmataceae bacterium]
MSTAPQDEPPELLPWLAPAFRFYLFVGLIGLLLIWLGLFQKGHFLFAFIPALNGLAGMAPYLLPPRWKYLTTSRWLLWMPFLLLGFLFFIEAMFGYGWAPHLHNFELADLLLAPGLLAYLAAQFRLYSLAGGLAPVDRRPRPDTIGGDEPEPRPPASFAPAELWPLAWGIPLVVLAGQLIWWLVTSRETLPTSGYAGAPLDMERHHWRIFALIWILGGGAILIAGFLKIMRMYRMSAAEAGMIAQDSVWAETRGEQRRTSRWLA